MDSSQATLQAFGVADYQIVDEDFERTGKLTIWSCSPFRPQIGELLNVQTRAVLRELVVSEVRLLLDGWAATCRSQRA